MKQEDFNEIRDKHPSPEAEIEYRERIKNQEIESPSLPIIDTSSPPPPSPLGGKK